MMTASKRRLSAKGKWMQLRDPAILQAYINARRPEMNQSKLAEYSGCSRQFIGRLLKPREDKLSKKGCTPKLAEAIEDVLGAPRGAIFMPKMANESVIKSPRPQTTRPSAGKLRLA